MLQNNHLLGVLESFDQGFYFFLGIFHLRVFILPIFQEVIANISGRYVFIRSFQPAQIFLYRLDSFLLLQDKILIRHSDCFKIAHSFLRLWFFNRPNMPHKRTQLNRSSWLNGSLVLPLLVKVHQVQIHLFFCIVGEINFSLSFGSHRL